jgi:hypothetical protein
MQLYTRQVLAAQMEEWGIRQGEQKSNKNDRTAVVERSGLPQPVVRKVEATQ